TASAVTIPIKHAASFDDLVGAGKPPGPPERVSSAIADPQDITGSLRGSAPSGRRRFMRAALGQAVPMVAIWPPAAIGAELPAPQAPRSGECCPKADRSPPLPERL